MSESTTVVAGRRPVRLRDLRHGAASLMPGVSVPMTDTARAPSDAIGRLLDAALRPQRLTVRGDDEVTPPVTTGAAGRARVRHQGLEPRTR